MLTRLFPGRGPSLAALTALAALAVMDAGAAVVPVGSGANPARPGAIAIQQQGSLVDRMSQLRSRVIALEAELLDGLKNQRQAKSNLKKIKTLLQLQRMERELGQKRMGELERTISELESRRAQLREKIVVHQRLVRRSLMDLGRSMREQPRTFQLPERERIEAPRRKVLSRLVDLGVKEIEALRVDLADADHLEARIQEEKQQMAYLFQDLKEQESVLEFNQRLQGEILKKSHEDRIAQLESYRKLKSAEGKVERLIKDFNARVELQKTIETERLASRAMMQGAFARLKGTLPLPIAEGRVVSSFGRAFDPKSNLYIFKKGIDIASGARQPVRAVSAGKIAYSGELPDYGRVAIVDHGDHFYSLCAHLGEIHRKAGDAVAAGDVIGSTDDSATPVYFEIRARNVAVNPLQWVSN